MFSTNLPPSGVPSAMPSYSVTAAPSATVVESSTSARAVTMAVGLSVVAILFGLTFCIAHFYTKMLKVDTSVSPVIADVQVLSPVRGAVGVESPQAAVCVEQVITLGTADGDPSSRKAEEAIVITSAMEVAVVEMDCQV